MFYKYNRFESIKLCSQNEAKGNVGWILVGLGDYGISTI